jgi:hypothetical protein
MQAAIRRRDLSKKRWKDNFLMLNTRPLIMLAIFLVLLVLPVKVKPKHLLGLAFFLWLSGGIMLTLLGFDRLNDPAVHPDIMLLGMAGLAAVVIGMAKGKFVLSKTSRKNIERIQALSEPQRPVHVYSTRSWIVVALMVLISILLNTLPGIDLFWRGLVNLAIGFALIISSLDYLRVLGRSAQTT